MGKIYLRIALVIAVMIVMISSIMPPAQKLKLGKDLAGGATLLYSVTIKPGENAAEVLQKTIEVLKNRVDPDGLAEISFVAQGRDRIEISMPLPGPEVKELRRAFEAELATLGRFALRESSIDDAVKLPAAQRDAEISSLVNGDAKRIEKFRAAADKYDQAQVARAEYEAGKLAGADKAALDALIAKAAELEAAYEEARSAVAKSGLTSTEVQRVIQLSDESRALLDEQTGEKISIKSPRAKAIERLKAEHPDSVEALERVLASYKKYASSRKAMDDPSDLVKQLRGAGVLNFRIGVKPGWDPTEVQRLRQQLAERGPKNIKSNEVRWFKVNQIRNWYNNTQQLKALDADPVGFFASRKLIGAEYDGEYYVLCFDTRTTRLTEADGDWSVSRAYDSRDQVGRPSIAFEMDPRGAVLLGNLTREHVGDEMAVLLDDEVYTAPTLQGNISKSGQITGDFPPDEIRYIVRVLGAGSLQAKLSPEPISTNFVGPELGKDNLDKGLHTGLVAFAVVSAFMVVYYFGCGLVAVIALMFTGTVILGAMALNKAAFTLPGIAGIVLTFGQAVDANVLIYERMREELKRGHDMKTAVRVGFSRAMPSIVDANVAHLIICIVLNTLGTQEIRGFAITLGIGVVATLFSAIVVSRLIFDLLVGFGHWTKASMLPIAVPALQRVLEPRIDWLKLRPIFITASIVTMVASLWLVVNRGQEAFDTEFRGGTQVTLELGKNASGEDKKLTRKDVEERIRSLEVPKTGGLAVAQLKTAEVLPINPDQDGVTSAKFKIKTIALDSKAVLSAVRSAFAGEVEAEPELAYRGSDAEELAGAPVFRVIGPLLSESVGAAGKSENVKKYQGGIAILLENITPPVSIDSLTSRLQRERLTSTYSDTLERMREVRVLSGTNEAVTTAVVLVNDPEQSFYDNDQIFDRNVALREWKLAREATVHAASFASVESFSPAVADTFKVKAFQSVAVSMSLLILYIWIRYGTIRWSLAATLPLVHDIIALLGLLALAQLVYDAEATKAFAGVIGLLPFKIDLNMVAALLMIAGFSLNDKVIILDRIRENRGRSPYATGQIVNDSINQTISRTLITSGTTLITTVILYVFGGEGVRGFAYAFTLGVLIGTYSSIAVAAPLVWSRKLDAKAAALEASGALKPA